MKIAYGLNIPSGRKALEGSAIEIRVHEDGAVRLHSDDIEKIANLVVEKINMRDIRLGIKGLDTRSSDKV